MSIFLDVCLTVTNSLVRSDVQRTRFNGSGGQSILTGQNCESGFLPRNSDTAETSSWMRKYETLASYDCTARSTDDQFARYSSSIHLSS